MLGVPFEKVTVLHSDTALLPRGAGTMGSRSLQKGGSAVHRAGTEVVEKAKRIAAHLLEARPADIELTEGPVRHRRGARAVGRLAGDRDDGRRRGALPEGEEPGLRRGRFDAGGTSFPFGAHVAVAEVDVETGDARLVRIVAVDDCGRILNPMLVEGQQHGGLARGSRRRSTRASATTSWATR